MNANPKLKPLLRVLAGEAGERPPFWLMRQAGRYLPEYREVRARAGSFLDLCYSPDLAAEVTLQPIRRFCMDAAIIFSDILVVPHALGQGVRFEEGRGPVLDAVRQPADLAVLSNRDVGTKLAPVYEAIRNVGGALPAETALIGFCGGPWTVASYMVEGGTSRDFVAVKRWAYSDPASFGDLIDILIEASSEHLCNQIEAGAEVVQIFESWAGVLPDSAFERWCIRPVRQMVEKVADKHPETPIIVFPRGAGVRYGSFHEETGCDGLGLDTTVPLAWAQESFGNDVTLQGNLDPLLLVVGGDPMIRGIDEIVGRFRERPFIFNLGHGVLPETPPENVAMLARVLRDL